MLSGTSDRDTDSNSVKRLSNHESDFLFSLRSFFGPLLGTGNFENWVNDFPSTSEEVFSQSQVYQFHRAVFFYKSIERQNKFLGYIHPYIFQIARYMSKLYMPWYFKQNFMPTAWYQPVFHINIIPNFQVSFKFNPVIILLRFPFKFQTTLVLYNSLDIYQFLLMCPSHAMNVLPQLSLWN